MSKLPISCIAAAMTFGLLAAVSANAPAKGDAAKGKAIFESNCAVCHYADSDKKKVGPGLKGLFKQAKLVNGKQVTEANVRALIDAGGNGMPPYEEMLSSQEKNDLIAYLKTL